MPTSPFVDQLSARGVNLSFPKEEKKMYNSVFDENSDEVVEQHQINSQQIIAFWEWLSNAFSIIQLRGQTKIATEKDWSKYCHVKRTFNKNDFKNNNAGVACGPASKVIVLDIDDVDLFNAHLKANSLSLPKTFTVKTGGDGLHYYYKYPTDGNEYGNRSCQSEGFDIRGVGGYVVAPGSIHPDTGALYEVAANVDLAPAPQWLLDLAKKDKPKDEAKEADQAQPMNDGVAMEEVQVPGDVNINALGLPEEVLIEILTPHKRGTRSEAEMSVLISLVKAGIPDNVIEAIFEEHPIGEKHRESGKSRHQRLKMQLQKAKKVAAGTKKYGVKTASAIVGSDKQMSFLVDDLLPQGETLLIIGQGGVGKSLFTLDLAISLADAPSMGFLGHFKVNNKCKVLFVQAENCEAGTKERLNSMLHNHPNKASILDNIGFVSVDDDVMLFGHIEDDSFCEKIATQAAKFNADVLLIDPLSSFHHADENSNVQMRQVLDKLSRLGQQMNVSIVLVHHDGKMGNGSSSAGGRGASAIGDWASSSIVIQKGKPVGNVTLEHAKSRYGRIFEKLNLRREDSLRYSIIKTQDEVENDKETILAEAFQSLNSQSVVQADLIRAVQSVLQTNGQKVSSENTIRAWINKSGKFVKDSSDNKLKLA